jgi:hypothetical protein
MGQIAFIASIASFIGAGGLLLLSLFGFVHLRRVDPDQEVLAGSSHHREPATV